MTRRENCRRRTETGESVEAVGPGEPGRTKSQLVAPSREKRIVYFQVTPWRALTRMANEHEFQLMKIREN
jgi:hypothetical protein